MKTLNILFMLWGVLLFPHFGFGECRSTGDLKNEYTNDFYFSASSAEGAPGEVIGFDLNLTIEQSYGEYLYGVSLVAAYNSEFMELLGEPLYAEGFWEFANFPFFYELAETEGLSGFLIGWSVGQEIWTKFLEKPEKFFGVPIPIGRIYFRLRGPIGENFELRFVDNILGGSVNQCIQNDLYFFENHRSLFHTYSIRHLPGLVRIVDREPISTEPPPLPPNAKIYMGTPTTETASVRYELLSPVTTPGSIVPVDYFITSNHEFIGYVMGGKFPTEYLELERIEVLTTRGANLVDNERGEFGILSMNSRRRIGAEGERVHAARLYFRVKEAARSVGEVRISLEDLTLPDSPVKSYVNRIRILQSDGSAGIIPTEVEVYPLVLAGSALKIRSGPKSLRGDANFDSQLDTTDAIVVLQYLFLGNSEPACPIAADFDLSGELDITDPINLLQSVYLGEPPLASLKPAEVPCE